MTSTLATVQPGSFLTLHYRMAGPVGDVISTFDGKPATLTLGTGELSPTLEAYLLGLPEGTHATFELHVIGILGPRALPRRFGWPSRVAFARAWTGPSRLWSGRCKSLAPLSM